jgi:uncharacterized membrane protein
MSFVRPGMASDSGKGAAILVYVLYLVSLPSIGILMFVGVIWAYLARKQAAGWVRTHLDHAIKVFWTTFWWTVLIIALSVVGFFLTVIAIGFAIWWVVGIAGAVLAIWYHLVAVIGLIRLLQDKPA